MNIIEMKGISKRFGNTVALDNVDFFLREKEILSLMGENGAGKTTMKLIQGTFTIKENQYKYTDPLMRSIFASVWCISISCWFPR